MNFYWFCFPPNYDKYIYSWLVSYSYERNKLKKQKNKTFQSNHCFWWPISTSKLIENSLSTKKEKSTEWLGQNNQETNGIAEIWGVFNRCVCGANSNSIIECMHQLSSEVQSGEWSKQQLPANLPFPHKSSQHTAHTINVSNNGDGHNAFD